MAQKICHSLYCHDATWQQVRLVAARYDRSLAWVLEKALEEYLAKHVNPDDPTKKGE